MAKPAASPEADAAFSTSSWPSRRVLAASKPARSDQTAGSALVSPCSEPGGKRVGMVRNQAIMSSIRGSSAFTSPRASATGLIASMCPPIRFSPARRSAMASPCAIAVPASATRASAETTIRQVMPESFKPMIAIMARLPCSSASLGLWRNHPKCRAMRPHCSRTHPEFT